MVKIIILLVVVALSSTALAQIHRPCAFNNYKCIRNILAANSYCTKNVIGSVPNKYFLKNFRFETPYFNSSHIERPLTVRNHNKCFVSEFFYNTVTDTYVLTIDCPNLDLEADRVLIQHRSKKEDEYYYYYIRSSYKITRFTANLPRFINMDLCEAHVLADVVTMSVKHIHPQDQKTANLLSTHYLSRWAIHEREYWNYLGYDIMKIFVDRLLCKFNCP